MWRRDKDKSKDKDGVSGDGNTNLKFKNVNKQPIGGWDTEADNEQSIGPCPGSSLG